MMGDDPISLVFTLTAQNCCAMALNILTGCVSTLVMAQFETMMQPEKLHTTCFSGGLVIKLFKMTKNKWERGCCQGQ